MSFGTVPERTAFLASHPVPILAPPPALSAAENLAASDKNADIMREAMQDVRQQNMDAGADKKDGITGRFIAAGTAFAVMAIMRRSLDLFSLSLCITLCLFLPREGSREASSQSAVYL